MSEKSVHLAVCQYIRVQYPDVLFNTDLSGIKLTIGQATQLKRLRSGRGFPDIVIYEPRNNFNGLFLELKREGEELFKKDKTTFKTPHLEEQYKILCKLNNRGYKAVFAVGFDEAKKIIDSYLR